MGQCSGWIRRHHSGPLIGVDILFWWTLRAPFSVKYQSIVPVAIMKYTTRASHGLYVLYVDMTECSGTMIWLDFHRGLNRLSNSAVQQGGDEGKGSAEWEKEVQK